MKIDYEGREWLLEIDHVRLRHARAIQAYTGLSFDEWSDTLNAKFDDEGNALNKPPQFLDSLAALYWLMLAQNGDETAAIDDADPDVQGFYLAFAQARMAELMELVEKAKAAGPDPTKRRPRGRKAAPTESREQSSPTDTTPETSGPQQDPNGTESGPPAT